VETHRNIEVIWLLRHLKPDFKTSPTSGTTPGRPSGRYSGSLCCCAGSLICSAGSCWRSTGPGVRKGGAPPDVPKPQRGPAVRKGFFSKDEFRYDPARDVYICPAGETLAPHHEGRLRDLKKIDYSNRAACLVCPLRSRCTTSHRRVSRGRAGPDGRPTEGQAVFWLK